MNIVSPNDTTKSTPMKSRFVFPLHPFLIAVYPVLFLIAHNDLRFWNYAPLPILVLLGATTVVLIAIKFVMKNLFRAGLATSGILVVFFTTCPVYDFLTHTLPYIGKDMIWVIFLLELILLILLLRLLKKELAGLTFFLNTLASLLVAFTLWGIVSNALERRGTNETESVGTGEMKKTIDRPDIYMIIFDSYAGRECLEQLYDFDNSSFYDAMKQRGYTVVENSRSNYISTQYSLPSTLNMQYVDEMFDKNDLETLSANRLKRLTLSRLVDNDVAKYLRTQGYRYVHILNGWQEIGLSKTDPDDVLIPSRNDGEFLTLLMDMSLLRIFKIDPYNAKQRAETLLTFELLRDMPHRYTDKPKLVCAHLFPPQAPYCFHADGSERKAYSNEKLSPEQDVRFYLDQIEYVNSEIVRLSDRIFQQSEREPIVIIMSDHSSRLETETEGRGYLVQFPNLLAVSMPKNRDAELPRGLCNVNLFRRILNLEFGTGYPDLPSKYFPKPTEQLGEASRKKMDAVLDD